MSIQALEVARPVTGFWQMTSGELTVATVVKGTGSVVMLQAEGQAIRYRLDGVAPTPTVGIKLAVGETHTINVGEEGRTKVMAIETQPGGILNIHGCK